MKQKIHQRQASAALIMLLMASFIGCELPPPGCPSAEVQDLAPVSTDAFPALTSQKRVLILSMTAGWRHGNIETGVTTLKARFEKAGFVVEATEDRAAITASYLSQFRAIVLLSTTADFLGASDGAPLQALMQFVAAGGGILGIHAAGDGYRCGPYQQLIGGTFRSHPGNVREATCRTIGDHVAIVELPKSFQATDEFYLYYNFRESNKVLIECTSLDGKEQLPIAWHRTYGKGRIFYSGLGHEEAYWSNEMMLDKHLLPALQWVLQSK